MDSVRQKKEREGLNKEVSNERGLALVQMHVSHFSDFYYVRCSDARMSVSVVQCDKEIDVPWPSFNMLTISRKRLRRDVKSELCFRESISVREGIYH